MTNLPEFSVSDFVAITNQTLENAYPAVLIVGEVESFKVNQGKFVFFNLKDEESSVGCFMMLFALRVPIQDGMRVAVRARPKLTKFGKFSLTIDSIRPVGEGDIKKSFELLKQKLDKEGLFAAERKRLLPEIPWKIGVIASVQSAGYADFIKIIGERWPGVELYVHHVSVQGEQAPQQIIDALGVFNQRDELLDAVVVLRGGGSADDLAAFNDEPLVRAVAASRTPVMMAVGHEVDTTLCDLAADVRASTPSNAAQLLVPDRHEFALRVQYLADRAKPYMTQAVEQREREVGRLVESARTSIEQQIAYQQERVRSFGQLLESYNPDNVLRRGYALLRGEVDIGSVIEIETHKAMITAEVQRYEQK